MLADDGTRRVEAPDPDVVEVAGPVHRRARVGLGDDQQARRARLGAQPRRQLHEARGKGLARLRAQQPQPRAGNDGESQAVRDIHCVVAAVPYKREVVVRQPLEECARFADFFGGVGQPGAAELRVDGEHALAHRRPVGHHGAHVPQHAHDVGRQRVAAPGLGESVDLDVHQRLAGGAPLRGPGDARGAVARHLDDGVGDEVQRQPLAQQLHLHGVDQERHVVVDDLDDRVRRLPAVLIHRGVEHAHLGLPRFPGSRELPQRANCTVQVEHVPLAQVLGVDAGEVGLRERQQGVALVLGCALAQQRQRTFDALRGGGIDAVGHHGLSCSLAGTSRDSPCRRLRRRRSCLSIAGSPMVARPQVGLARHPAASTPAGGATSAGDSREARIQRDARLRCKRAMG